MNKSKKDLVSKQWLNKYILSRFEQGISVKKIQTGITHMTVDDDGGAIPKGYVEQVIYDNRMQVGAFGQKRCGS